RTRLVVHRLDESETASGRIRYAAIAMERDQALAGDDFEPVLVAAARHSRRRCRRTAGHPAAHCSRWAARRALCSSAPRCQLADLGVKLGRLALALLLAIPRTARPSREQARRIVERITARSSASVTGLER